MQYYSEITKKLYDTVPECEAAEKAFLKEQEDEKLRQEKMQKEEKAALDKIKQSYTNYINSQKEFGQTISDYINKFGDEDEKVIDLSDMLELFDEDVEEDDDCEITEDDILQCFKFVKGLSEVFSHLC